MIVEARSVIEIYGYCCNVYRSLCGVDHYVTTIVIGSSSVNIGR